MDFGAMLYTLGVTASTYAGRDDSGSIQTQITLCRKHCYLLQGSRETRATNFLIIPWHCDGVWHSWIISGSPVEHRDRKHRFLRMARDLMSDEKLSQMKRGVEAWMQSCEWEKADFSVRYLPTGEDGDVPMSREIQMLIEQEEELDHFAMQHAAAEMELEDGASMQDVAGSASDSHEVSKK